MSQDGFLEMVYNDRPLRGDTGGIDSPWSLLRSQSYTSKMVFNKCTLLEGSLNAEFKWVRGILEKGLQMAGHSVVT